MIGMPTLKTFLTLVLKSCLPSIQKNEGESSVVDEFLDSDVSKEEVKAAIRHLKNNKSPGPDSIMSEILKASDTAIVPFLVKYFHKLFSSGL